MTLFPLQAYLHAMSPYAVRFTEDYGVRWYGLAYLAGFVAGYFLIRWVIARGYSPLKEEQAGDFVFLVALGAVIGGRLGYCLFYAPELFLDFGARFPFWKVLAVNEGGMASHGGMLGILLVCLYYGRRHKIASLHLADLTTLGGTAGIFFGRIANFVNGELIGRPAPEWLIWGVKFPQEVFLWFYTEPDRLRELTPALKHIGVAPGRWYEFVDSYQRDPWVWRNVEETLVRLVTTVQEGDLVLQSALAPILTSRHPSQIYEAMLEGALLFALAIWIWRKPRLPGFVTGIFFSGYAIVRIFCENFRMPDAQIGYQLFGLTRGQWLSIALFAAGVILLWISKDGASQEQEQDEWHKPSV